MSKKRLAYVCSVLVMATLCWGSAGWGATEPEGSPKVAGLLSDAKDQVRQLVVLTDEYESFTHLGTRVDLSWRTHAAQLARIKQTINELGITFNKLNENQAQASPEQRAAIDRLTPVLQEMAANLEATFEHLNMSRAKLTNCVREDPKYKEIVKTDYDTALKLNDLVAQSD